MATYYLICINKRPTHSDPHCRIEYIGTNEPWNATTYSFRLTSAQVISAIESGHVFYSTDAKGERVLCIVVEHEGPEYVKTASDGIHPNNPFAKPDEADKGPCGGQVT